MIKYVNHSPNHNTYSYWSTWSTTQCMNNYINHTLSSSKQPRSSAAAPLALLFILFTWSADRIFRESFSGCLAFKCRLRLPCFIVALQCWHFIFVFFLLSYCLSAFTSLGVGSDMVSLLRSACYKVNSLPRMPNKFKFNSSKFHQYFRPFRWNAWFEKPMIVHEFWNVTFLSILVIYLLFAINKTGTLGRGNIAAISRNRAASTTRSVDAVASRSLSRVVTYGIQNGDLHGVF